MTYSYVYVVEGNKHYKSSAAYCRAHQGKFPLGQSQKRTIILENQENHGGKYSKWNMYSFPTSTTTADALVPVRDPQQIQYWLKGDACFNEGS